MSNLSNSLSEVAKQVETAKKALQADVRGAFEGAVKDYFSRAPEGCSFVWSQYTPYFNDGEPCYFRVNEVEVRVPLTEGETRAEEDDYGDRYAWGDNDQSENLSKDLQEDALAISSFIERQDDLMETLYGDHAIVTLSAAGASIESYDHD